MYEGDFFLTWDKTDDEIEAVFTVADALRYMRENNISTKIFESGLGISLFRDNSTRTRFSFASACNLLGLEVQDLDEGKSQIAHGETVRETANMISFMADVIGIRDDMYIGKGHTRNPRPGADNTQRINPRYGAADQRQPAGAVPGGYVAELSAAVSCADLRQVRPLPDRSGPADGTHRTGSGPYRCPGNQRGSGLPGGL